MSSIFHKEYVQPFISLDHHNVAPHFFPLVGLHLKVENKGTVGFFTSASLMLNVFIYCWFLCYATKWVLSKQLHVSAIQQLLLSTDKLSHSPLCVRWQACEWEWWGKPCSPGKQNGGWAALHVRFTGAVNLRAASCEQLLVLVEWPKTDPFLQYRSHQECVISIWAEEWIPF